MNEPNVYLRFPAGERAWMVYGGDWKQPVAAVLVKVHIAIIDADGSTSYNVAEETRDGEFVSFRGFHRNRELFDTEEEPTALAELCNLSERPLETYFREINKRQLPPKGDPNVHVPFPPRSEVLFVIDDWWPESCPECEGKSKATVEDETCPVCYGRGIKYNTEENYAYGPLITRPATITAVEMHEKSIRYDLNVHGMSEAAIEIVGERYGRNYGDFHNIFESFVYADAETAEAAIARANAYRAEHRSRNLP